MVAGTAGAALRLLDPGDRSKATLVLHLHREVIHHGAEVALLRDLFLRRA